MSTSIIRGKKASSWLWDNIGIFTLVAIAVIVVAVWFSNSTDKQDEQFDELSFQAAAQAACFTKGAPDSDEYKKCVDACREGNLPSCEKFKTTTSSG